MACVRLDAKGLRILIYKRRCGSLRRDRTVAITFRLDKEDADALDYIAKILGVSRSWIVRKLVKNGLEDLYIGETAKRRLFEDEREDFEELEDQDT